MTFSNMYIVFIGWLNKALLLVSNVFSSLEDALVNLSMFDILSVGVGQYQYLSFSRLLVVPSISQFGQYILASFLVLVCVCFELFLDLYSSLAFTESSIKG